MVEAGGLSHGKDNLGPTSGWIKGQDPVSEIWKEEKKSIRLLENNSDHGLIYTVIVFLLLIIKNWIFEIFY